MIFRHLKKYWHLALLAAAFMVLEVLVDHPDKYSPGDIDAVLAEAELMAPSIMKQPEKRKTVSKIWPALLIGAGAVLSATLLTLLGHDDD